MIKNFVLFSVLGVFLFISNLVLARNHVYFGFNAGLNFARIGVNNVINYQDVLGNAWTDEYIPNKQYSSGFLAGLNAGYDVALGRKSFVDIGVGVYHSWPQAAKGQLWNTIGDIHEHAFDYRYRLQSTRTMGELTLGWNIKRISPFITAGIGAAWKKAYDYKDYPVGGPYVTYPFKSDSTTRFAYQLGAGVNYYINELTRVGVIYRYVDLGKGRLGIRSATEFPYHLATGNLKEQDVAITFSRLL